MSKTLEEQLLQAVDDRDHDLVKSLIDRGAQPNVARDSSGRTCLLVAIRNWSLVYERHTKSHANEAYANGILTTDIELVRILLEAGADVTIKDWHKNSCLHYAAELDNTGEITKMLIEAGAKDLVNDGNEYKFTPLHVAIQQGDWLFDRKPVVRILIDAGAEISMAHFGVLTFVRLCQRNDEMFRILLEAPGADTVINCPDSDGITPFQLAVRYSRIDLVKQMIDRGADVNYVNPRDNYEGSALHIAANFALRNKILLLLEHGADPDLKNNKGETVFSIAAKNFMPCRHHNDIMRALLQHRKRQDGPEGCPPLQAMVQFGSIELFEFYLNLMKEGLVQPINEPLLHLASLNMKHPMLHYLLDRGICKIDEKDANGRTALHKLVEVYSSVPVGDHASIFKKRRYFQAIKNLIQNIALFESKNQIIDPAIFAIIEQNAEFKRFYSLCKNELFKLQCHVIDDPTTYHSIVAKDRIHRWIRNERVMNALEILNASSEDFSKLFPIYHNSFYINSREIKKRFDLMKTGVQALQSLLGIDSDTFLLIYHTILDNLRNEDLSNLSKIES